MSLQLHRISCCERIFLKSEEGDTCASRTKHMYMCLSECEEIRWLGWLAAVFTPKLHWPVGDVRCAYFLLLFRLHLLLPSMYNLLVEHLLPHQQSHAFFSVPDSLAGPERPDLIRGRDLRNALLPSQPALAAADKHSLNMYHACLSGSLSCSSRRYQVTSSFRQRKRTGYKARHSTD